LPCPPRSPQIFFVDCKGFDLLLIADTSGLSSSDTYVLKLVFLEKAETQIVAMEGVTPYIQLLSLPKATEKL
jgi:hypothetical protein